MLSFYSFTPVAQIFSWSFNSPDAQKTFSEMATNPKIVTYINDYSRFGFYEFDLGSGCPFWYGIRTKTKEEKGKREMERKT
jgi:hypothetical protein